ncbi:MAG TPA: serine/threonine-protein kinase [Phycisphaerales bacterium]|nr:serine/threonine-protein kinase [Phycisphaerales bacterium]
MTPEQFERLELLFEAAIGLSEDERRSLVEREAGDDPELAAKLEGMLASDSASLIAIDRPAMGHAFSVDEPDAFEKRLWSEFSGGHRFRILEKIGEGGFGAVYRAEQVEPVKRILALKVIKVGMDTRRFVARFESERQTLALMEHPGIARVYEAGATESGRPYFAMELVDGLPITQYLDGKRASIRERLELFIRVCNAVQHAHQKGIIHRDLKPRNVLVTEHDGVATPKVIDFGIARAVGADGGMTQMSDAGQPVGTPAYMSPEQAAGDPDIDTRTDVYSLGVLLYEILTGEPTLPRTVIERSTPAQIIRLVREKSAPRPSQRAGECASDPSSAQIASLRREDSRTLARRLRGDLDWILMCALEHDRARRYESVGLLAEDIARHLNNEPIRAHPPTAMYRLTKFAHRNRLGIAVAALVVAALIVTSVGLFRSVRSERRARTEAQIASAVNTFLNDDLLAAAAPEEMGSDVAMREVVETASRRIEGRFADQPEIEAAIRLTLGRTQSRLAQFADATKHLTRAYELRRGLFGEGDARTLEAVQELGQLAYLTEDYERARELFGKAAQGRRGLMGPDHPDTLLSSYWFAVTYGEVGRFAECEPMMTDVYERARRAEGDTAAQTLYYARGLALLYLSWQRPEQALPLFEKTHEQARATLGLRNHLTLLVMTDLSRLLSDLGELDRARSLLSDALEASKTLRGPHHPATLMIMGNLSWVLQKSGQSDRALAMVEQAIEIARRDLPAGHSTTMHLALSMGDILDAKGEFGRAGPLFEEAVRSLTARLGESHPMAMLAKRSLQEHLDRVAAARGQGAGPNTAPDAGHVQK